MAVYNAVQDAKVCVRAIRASNLVQGDPYRIDPNFVSMMGVGSGGYISLAYATIDNYAEVANPTKFQYTADGIGIFGDSISAGDPYIDTAVVGNWDGYNLFGNTQPSKPTSLEYDKDDNNNEKQTEEDDKNNNTNSNSNHNNTSNNINF